MSISAQNILDTLTHVRYPGTGKDIVSSGMVGDVSVEGNKVSFSLTFQKANDPFFKSVVKAAEQAIITYLGEDVDVRGHIAVKFKELPQVSKDESLLPGVKNIIAVFSGKGGVGKSTVSVNLSVALASLGYKVGLLDADIHGPSVPKMFAAEHEQVMAEERNGKQLMIPLEKYGVKFLSIGFFVDPKNALVWRGTIAGNALKQLISDAHWGELDYFVIDMPPGTGDIQLTLVQNLSITGAIVVTTPQEVALADARKGVNMFMNEKVGVPVLGLVENMAWFTPAELPDNKYYIFGKGGGERLAQELGIPLLAQIPIVQSICESGDEGRPVFLEEKGIFLSLARNLINKNNEFQQK